MVTKNAKNAQANYLQVDRGEPKINKLEEAEILSSKAAWEKYGWTRKYFLKKPELGYFVWIKKQPYCPVFSCVSIAGKKIKQDMQNLLVVEKNIKVDIQGTCNALEKNLSGIHNAEGKVVLKDGSCLNYSHLHSWGKKDFLNTNYDFILEKKAKLDYNYKILSSPEKAEVKTNVNLSENSLVNINIFGNFSNTQIDIKDGLILNGRDCSAMVKLRLAGNKNSRISACSQIKALSESKGHLDCQGLLVDKTAKISLIPKLICENNKAQLTHEASIGKISEQELIYLRTRGFTERQAIDLIVNGFLKK